MYGEERNLGVRYSADPNSPELAVITDKSEHGEVILASVLSTGEYAK